MKQCCRPGCFNEAIDTQNHRCRSCHAQYLREWRKLGQTRSVRAAYNRGMAEAREEITGMFQGMGDREFNGRTAAALVRQCSLS